MPETPKRPPRVLIFSGKGGVGKTTLAAATGLACARLGHRTIVVSVDVAHSLGDAFDLTDALRENPRGTPYRVEDNLEIQEIDVQEEVTRHWREVHSYFSVLFSETGVPEILAEDLALIPGMEDVVALLYLNQYVQEGSHDVIILDLAPTGESLRFVSMPDTLDWYMRRVFKFERRVAKAIRPFSKRMSALPLPEDSYFREIESLWKRMEGVDKVLSDPQTTSVRLVTNPERMVLKETRRAHLYFSLHGVIVDELLVNRVLPTPGDDEKTPRFLKGWYKTQEENLHAIHEAFNDVEIRTVPLMDDEVVGVARLTRVADALYGRGERGFDPATVRPRAPPYALEESPHGTQLKVRLPHLEKSELDLWVERDELILRIASQKHHYPLPTRLAQRPPTSARHEDGWLVVTFAHHDAAGEHADPVHLDPESPTAVPETPKSPARENAASRRA